MYVSIERVCYVSQQQASMLYRYLEMFSKHPVPHVTPTQGIHNNSQTLLIKNQLRKFNKFAYPIHVYRLAISCWLSCGFKIRKRNWLRNCAITRYLWGIYDAYSKSAHIAHTQCVTRSFRHDVMILITRSQLPRCWFKRRPIKTVPK